MDVFSNLTNQELVQHALCNKEGILVSNGALTVLTGKRKGRSPKDKYIVQDEKTLMTVDWGGINQPIMPKVFDHLWDLALENLNQHPIFEADLSVGSNPAHQINVNVQCNMAWHTLFCKIMFLPGKPGVNEKWTLINPAFFHPDPKEFGLNGPAAIVLDFTKKRILISGTQYGGEMKKALFTVMNYLLPEQKVLPMHCSATTDLEGRTTLFFGLSGTGKTTLSADPERLLIGDDEHGWGDEGIFNFEGGCYAKCIHLSQENEPLIWGALKDGALLENVVCDPHTLVPDFHDSSVTENTRAAYPLNHIHNKVDEAISPHPQHIVFLTCDLFGVLPPVSRLTLEQTRFYFLVGYTALVGSTEFGSNVAIKPTFSRCFGAPFFPRPAFEYADLLYNKIHQHRIPVYLVNTGWYGGAYGQGGQRFSIPTTRRIIQAINHGELSQAEWTSIPIFDLAIPKTIHGVESCLLNPLLSWSDSAHYEQTAHHLKNLLEKNYSDMIHSNQSLVSMAG